ncbi:MAG: tRNA (N6-threonylcarbamoyladenosine(37)-N6)-methyltransferase TrmO [Gammaproteobacteria bacterium]|nr:tRNA (N6-threonylcarbamoyladenosine(37)-N6)-methyltransferase TrmO [Gammaproteobacteria bacterium]MDH5692855.1 tRNA (N6-threonylcarbamoyladenosine(37)-N6)-methyltransferase TrmO [Gammaproteobacteria bacterium]
MSQTFSLTEIGVARTCFPEKFGVPRQPGLVSAATGVVAIHPEFSMPEAWKGLEMFSHIWLLFIFDRNQNQDWKPVVRPPRLGGNKKVGVFSTRSGFRPNPIGISCVELESVKFSNALTELHVRGLDLVDGTPILDIKPYIHYADAIHDANSAFANERPTSQCKVEFSADAEQILASLQNGMEMRRLIEQLISLNPIPAYQTGSDREYGMRLQHCNIKWKLEGKLARVFSIES